MHSPASTCSRRHRPVPGRPSPSRFRSSSAPRATAPRRLPSARQTMLFSATLDGEVDQLAKAFTDSPSRFEAETLPKLQSGDVEHRFAAVTTGDKLERLIEELEAERGLALVFVRTKRG